jgi:hypothetical protein
VDRPLLAVCGSDVRRDLRWCAQSIADVESVARAADVGRTCRRHGFEVRQQPTAARRTRAKHEHEQHDD